MAITTGGDDPSSSTSISLQHQHNKATAAASGQGRAAVGGPAALGHPRGTEGSGDRARRFLRGEAGKGLSDLVLEFDDSQSCIFTSKHYLSSLSSVLESCLAPLPEGENITHQRGGSRGKAHNTGGAASKSLAPAGSAQQTDGCCAASDRRQAYHLRDKKYMDVLEFLSICYISNDDEMTVTSSSLERMLALADEWIVPCMLHKCQKVLGEQLVKLKDLPTWHALVSPPPSSPQGLPGGKMAAESPNIDNLLMGFAYVASLAARYSLTKTWDRVLTMAEEVPLTKLAALLDSHVAFSSLAVEHRYSILIHHIASASSHSKFGSRHKSASLQAPATKVSESQRSEKAQIAETGDSPACPASHQQGH